MSIRPFLFSKSLRLLKPKAFENVFSHTSYRVSDRYLLILATKNNMAHPRLGLVIAKKNIKLAVGRNRVKRLIRESFRSRQHQLPAIDAIVLARKGLDQLNNGDIDKILDKLWQKLQTKVQNHLKEEQ